MKNYSLGTVLVAILIHVDHVLGTECPGGWVSSGKASCYLFAQNRASTFTEAEQYCQQHHNSHLVEVETAEENLFIRDFLRAFRAEHHWSGLTDEHTEGIWIWFSSGTRATYYNWGSGEPNSSGGNEDCVVFDFTADYTWTDTRCGNKFEPICELSVESEAVFG